MTLQVGAGSAEADTAHLGSDGIPAAQMDDRLAILPLDGVLEHVCQPAPVGVAGDGSDTASAAYRDDEAFIVERESVQRVSGQLGQEIVGHRLALLQRDLRERRDCTSCRGVDH